MPRLVCHALYEVPPQVIPALAGVNCQESTAVAQNKMACSSGELTRFRVILCLPRYRQIELASIVVVVQRHSNGELVEVKGRLALDQPQEPFLLPRGSASVGDRGGLISPTLFRLPYLTVRADMNVTLATHAGERPSKRCWIASHLMAL